MKDQVFLRRLIDPCFYLVVSNNPEAEVQEIIRHGMLVERACKEMFRGKITPSEMLELIEPCIPNMDDYLLEVEDNLSEILLLD
jgi:hypothetical protein